MFYVYVLRRLEISGFRRSDPHLQMDFPASAMMGTLSTKLDHMLQNSVFEQIFSMVCTYLASVSGKQMNLWMRYILSELKSNRIPKITGH